MKIRIDNSPRQQAFMIRLKYGEAARCSAVVFSAALVLPVLLSQQGAQSLSRGIQTVLVAATPSSSAAQTNTSRSRRPASGQLETVNPRGVEPSRHPALSSLRAALVAPLLQFPTRQDDSTSQSTVEARSPTQSGQPTQDPNHVDQPQDAADGLGAAGEPERVAQPVSDPRRTVRIGFEEAVVPNRQNVNPLGTQGSGGSAAEAARYQPLGQNLGSRVVRAANAPLRGKGFQVNQVTTFAGITSNSIPGGGVNRAFTNSNLGGDYDVGISADLGYYASNRGMSFSARYQPTHIQRGRFSDWSTTNHRMSLNWSKKLDARWTLTANATGGYYGVEQFAVRAPVLRQVTLPIPDLGSLLSAAGSGQLTNDEFASLLTGAPVVDDPGGNEFGISNIAGTGVNLSAQYRASARMTVFMRGQANGRRLVGQSLNNSFGSRLNRSRNYGATVGFDHVLRRGTTWGLTQATNSFVSELWTTSFHTSSVQLTQQFARRWQLNLDAGMGILGGDYEARRLANGGLFFGNGDPGALLVGSAQITYQGRAHSISFLAGRQGGGQLGERTSNRAGANWSWMRPGSEWGLTSGFNYSQYSLGPVGTFVTSFSNAGMFRRISPSLTLRTDYLYGQYESPYTGIVSGIKTHRAQVSMTWAPSERR